jgi:hypothetical protein
MDNLTFKQIKDLIDSNQDIGVVAGRNPSLDDMGAALSLYLAITALGKNAVIAAPEQPTVEISNLVGINKVKSGLGGQGGDLIVSFPYKEGEIDKVSYTLENEFLNIVVKEGPSGLNFAQQDVKFTRGTGKVPKVLFVVGSPRLSDMANIFDIADLKDTTVINIDNKAENQGFGDLVMVSTNSSSVSELVANLIMYLGFPVDQDIAQNLLSGITFATNDFSNPNTSSLAFEMAGVLMRNGAKRISLVRQRSTDFDSFVPAKPQTSSQVPASPLDMPMPRPQPIMRPTLSQPQSAQAQNMPKQSSEDVIARLRKQILESQKRQEQRASATPVEAQPQVDRFQEPTPIDAVEQEKIVENPPEDWLTPKIYKGSTNF